MAARSRAYGPTLQIEVSPSVREGLSRNVLLQQSNERPNGKSRSLAAVLSREIVRASLDPLFLPRHVVLDALADMGGAASLAPLKARVPLPAPLFDGALGALAARCEVVVRGQSVSLPVRRASSEAC